MIRKTFVRYRKTILATTAFLAAVALVVMYTGWRQKARETRERPHVLVLFSQSDFRYRFSGFPEAIEEAFSRIDIDTDLTISFLGSEQWNEEQEIERCRTIITEADQQKPLSLLVTIGDEATYSSLMTGLEIVKRVPIVFANVMYPNMKLISKQDNITGFSDAADVKTNILLAEKLTGRRVTFTELDQTYLDRQTRQLINQQLKGTIIINNLDWSKSVMDLMTVYHDRFSITGLSLRDLNSNVKQGEVLSKKGTENVVRVLRCFKDLIYIQLKNDAAMVKMVRWSNNYPMITGTMHNFGGEGSPYIGGYFASAEQMAQDAASSVKKVLKGTKPKDIPITESRKDYYFDWQVGKIFGFTVDNLPQGFHIVNMPWRDRHPTLYLLFIYLTAITIIATIIILSHLYWAERKRKRAAMKIAERENTLYNMAVQDNQTFAWERIGRTIYLSNAFWEYFGQEPHTITVDDFRDMLHPDSRPYYDKGLNIVGEGGLFATEVQADFSGDGRYLWYKIKGKASTSNEKSSYGMLTNVEDYKARERELVESRKLAEEATLKESFLANMSHEIRTPLNAIVGFSNLLLTPDNDFTDEDKEMFRETINKNNDLLLKLINDILDLSRMESGEMEFIIKPCSVSSLMTQLRNTFTVQLPQHLKFRYTEGARDVEVQVDENRLRQVVSNFLTNAGKFTHEGSITLGWEVYEERNKVELYVEDTGIGLSEDDRKMVFSRFYKKNEFAQGTGLGLSICKAIVIRLGGSIKVKSELGKGSRFSVWLPIGGSGGGNLSSSPQEHDRLFVVNHAKNSINV